ncbi:LysR family transcriptional regulator [Vibrio parahaemolyticus]|uniref:LysR family transcriptional regulator n=2 Tax=Vibrio parahaemolyticus TaxID=670 RepID=UPI00186A8489|nr:LysR family transcriptional regulator [Vibrio parahaemolyticus]EGQ8102973.1 LysR family transcriptional regulator [Vibrio parahaemolyticus]EGQ8408298.1 LysR family transcriptional regulator [Vibrio parahaemolyticus]EGQ9823946.1 LysR family transcriptional regulator [Vibrio parahaemolyticus]EJB8407874.1 LysR family transcriptional regulator [Vibrio parahaemolyticus]EJB8532546.1 LysR family transcriptional regulator [Vibrio parahaemolyticus]
MLNEKLLISKDLNLLLLLVTLHEEQSTTRAAERLFVTQSAVSKGLKRLREQFDESLFVRTRQGFIPTEKCDEIVSRITPLLMDIECIYRDSHRVKTQHYSGEISVAISSPIYFALANDVYFQLNQDFPNATIRLVNWSESTEKQLLNTKIQVGINYLPIDISKDLIHQSTLPVDFHLLARKNHPLRGKIATLEEIAQFPLVVSTIPNFTNQKSKIEHTLSKFKLGSTIILRSDDANICLTTLKQTDALMPVNNYFAQKASKEHTTINTNFKMNSYLPPTNIGLFYSNHFIVNPIGKLIQNSINKALLKLKQHSVTE